ncbi:MAG: hypothetical protein LBQ32_08930 [Burkholderiaceae bacterium]|jgi:hypothetical protein|nr:hypothetical protein [Burkholderiaceae bacterium]
MQRFTHSPMRGWRWLYGFFGLTLVGSAGYVFSTWTYAASIDLVMLVFPTLLLVAGGGLLYIAVLLDDERLGRFSRFVQRYLYLRSL